MYVKIQKMKLTFFKNTSGRAVTICHKGIAIYCDMWQAYCNNITIYCPKISRNILG